MKTPQSALYLLLVHTCCKKRSWDSLERGTLSRLMFLWWMDHHPSMLLHLYPHSLRGPVFLADFLKHHSSMLVQLYPHSPMHFHLYPGGQLSIGCQRGHLQRPLLGCQRAQAHAAPTHGTCTTLGNVSSDSRRNVPKLEAHRILSPRILQRLTSARRAIFKRRVNNWIGIAGSKPFRSHGARPRSYNTGPQASDVADAS